MGDLHWKTAITKVEPNKLTVRENLLCEMIGVQPFPKVVFLILQGRMPSDNEAKMLDAILTSTIDHGATPPSTLAARTVASCGVPLSSALAAGILAIGRSHGGAVEDCMKMLQILVSRSREENISIRDMARTIISEYRERKRRLSGYGHRYHTHDPRTRRMFEIAEETGLNGTYLEAAQAISTSFSEDFGKHLPLNVDGAVAAVLCEMQFPPEMGNAFFIIGRVPGLVAHIYEEMTKQRPMRKIHPIDHSYDPNF